MAMMTGLVIYSPTLYRMFCSLTGYNGTVRRVSLPKAAVHASDIPTTVSFDANVAPDLPWEFRPEQQRVTTHFGEPTKVYYYAKNNSDRALVGRAVFNVTPFAAAPFFFKIECFCFTDEKLGPGESAHMPLVFYVDEEMLKDPDAQMLTELTLSYTFYNHLFVNAIPIDRNGSFRGSWASRNRPAGAARREILALTGPETGSSSARQIIKS